MYPNLYYFFKDVFGVSWPLFKAINSFGFFMTLSFFAAAWALTSEFNRQQKAGLLTYTEEAVITGETPNVMAVLPIFLWAGIIGYKFAGFFTTAGAVDDLQGYLLSPQGNIIGGLLCGLAFAAWKWYDIKKLEMPAPEKKTVRVWPSERVTIMTVIAAVTGIIGAKIFDNLEHWQRFIQDPLGNLFSRNGFTFYGGLITATIAIISYLRSKKIPVVRVADAIAPALMLAYCVGRMGCQVAGDGDWGIINSAYLTKLDGTVVPSTAGTRDTAFAMYNDLYVDSIGQRAEHKAVKAFAGLPVWLFASSYSHNTNKAGIHTVYCKFDDYCTHLPLPVFPTPLYEVIMAGMLFVLLWVLRKRMKIPGRLAATYLFVNGFERLLIEQIRVNSKYNIFGFHPTQAEIIAALLMLAGIVLWWYAPRINPGNHAQPAVTS